MVTKKQIRKWSLRLSVTALLILGLLVGIVLNPILLYACKDNDGNYTIYSQAKLDTSFVIQLHKANELVRSGELYDNSVQLSLCLDDGSFYPGLLRAFTGPVFGLGFERKVVLMGNINAGENFAEINGYKWNLVELIAHEATHCFQFHRYGLWQSNPVAHIPNWKWEGYPEYIARKNKANLADNIRHLQEVEKTDNNNWIDFSDGTGTVIPYYKSWLLVQYCIDIRKMSYDQVLKDRTAEAIVTQQMMAWYEANSHAR